LNQPISTASTKRRLSGQDSQSENLNLEQALEIVSEDPSWEIKRIKQEKISPVIMKKSQISQISDSDCITIDDNEHDDSCFTPDEIEQLANMNNIKANETAPNEQTETNAVETTSNDSE
jgi:hypothetical protein